MHASILILLLLLSLLLGGLALGAYLVAADKLYSKDKQLTASRRRPKPTRGVKVASPPAVAPDPTEPAASAEEKRP